MSLFSAFPPTRLHGPGTRISQSDAQKFVADYLRRAETEPSLHPDSVLTATGVRFATAGGTPGLVMNQLRRFEAGLRGVDLAPEDEEINGHLGEPEAEGESTWQNGGKGATAVVDDVGDPLEGAMWQDKEEFEREQEDVHGDPREMGPPVVEEGPRNRGNIVPNVKEAGVDEGPNWGGGVDAGEMTAKEKERRKREKKERRQKDKREREERRTKKREKKGKKDSDDESG